MMYAHINAMMGASEKSSGTTRKMQMGTISAYNPATYSVKVFLQPSAIESGWLPIQTPYVGNGWGFQVGPQIGDMVTVQFQEGDQDAGVVIGSIYNTQDQPMSVPSGEAWMQHKSGSFIKFHNDGSIEVSTTGNLTATVGGSANIAVAGNIASKAAQWNHTGPFNVAGMIASSAGLTVSGGDITADGYSLKNHHHVTSGTNSGGAIP